MFCTFYLYYCEISMKGLEICQTIDDKAAESVILLNLGVTCELTGQIHKAIEWHTLVSYVHVQVVHAKLYFFQYLSMTVETNDLHGQARAYSTLAELSGRTGQTIKSLHYFKKVKLQQILLSV